MQLHYDCEGIAFGHLLGDRKILLQGIFTYLTIVSIRYKAFAFVLFSWLRMRLCLLFCDNGANHTGGVNVIAMFVTKFVPVGNANLISITQYLIQTYVSI